MNVKTFLTLASVINLFYGILYFFFPEYTASIYGTSGLSTPLSDVFLQFLGIYGIASAVLCWICRRAEVSPGRTAVLAFLAVTGLLFFYMDIKILLGAPGTMDYVDTVVNGLLGIVALYFMLKDRQVGGA